MKMLKQFKKIILLLVLIVSYQVCNVSAYTSSVEECGKSDGITASGIKAVEGITVAADHLAFGTVVVIDGHRYIVQDRFGGGYKDRLDIYMDNVEEAWKFGRQDKMVRIEVEK